MGDYGRISKQITAYLEETRLPSFLPRSAEDISLTFKENESLVNGKFHLPIERSLHIQKELTIATVDDLKDSQEAIPGDYNGANRLSNLLQKERVTIKMTNSSMSL